MPMRQRLAGFVMTASERLERRPGELDTLLPQQGLEFFEKRGSVPDLPRHEFPFKAEACEKTGGLADVPFHRMEAECTIGDVRHAKVLSARQQVFHPHWDHGAQRDLKRPAAEVEVAGPTNPWVEVDPVAADSDGVGKDLWSIGPERIGNVLFSHRELRAQTARFADVWRLRQPVGRSSHHVTAEPQLRIAEATFWAWRLRL